MRLIPERLRLRVVPRQDRGPALGSSCLGGLLATGLALALTWLDVRFVAGVWDRCDESADGFFLLVTTVPTVLAYLVALVLGDDVAVRAARPGADLWFARLTLLTTVFALGTLAFLLLHGLPVHNARCPGVPWWLPS